MSPVPGGVSTTSTSRQPQSTPLNNFCTADITYTGQGTALCANRNRRLYRKHGYTEAAGSRAAWVGDTLLHLSWYQMHHTVCMHAQGTICELAPSHKHNIQSSNSHSQTCGERYLGHEHVSEQMHPTPVCILCND